MPDKGLKDRSVRIRLLIVVGYLVLCSLSFYGVYRVYAEFKEYSENEPSFDERKELVLVSNILANLYEAESISRLFFMEQKDLRLNTYDSLKVVIGTQVDSLHCISSDTLIRSRLDSVAYLLNLKYNNTLRVTQLMDSINKLPLQQKTKTTILSEREIDNLNTISKLYMRGQRDTTIAQVKKKSFTKRLSDVFKSKVVDSVVVTSNVNSMVVDSVLPVQLLVDTITEYLTDVMLEYNQKREWFIYQLSYRQSQLFLTNERLTSQINDILYGLERNEYLKNLQLMMEKERALSRSSKTAFRVALAAMITAILFLGLSLGAISRELKYRRQLERAKKYAEDLLRSRERLMLTISHDIKAPLSSIIGYLELLAKCRLQTKEKYYLDNMQRSSEHVLELVTKLLDYHRLESGTQDSKNMYFSPYRLLTDLYQGFIPLVERKGLEFEFVNELEPSIFYSSDPFRIRQVLNNLLSNALKFTEKGKITLKASVKPSGSEQGVVLTVVVKDTGCGIDQVNLENIFEEFHRTESSDVQNIEGAGLGLTITRKIVSLLKGKIVVKSEKNKGSEFTVLLPLEEGEVQGVKEVHSEERKLRVLFIDDDRVLLNMYTEFLKQEGFLPVVCSDPVEALRILQQSSFDIIFTDIQMPGMNGFELVERIRSSSFDQAKSVPVIALSARSDVPGAQFEEAGFTGFLAKPFSFDQLLDILVRYANISRPEREPVDSKGFDSLTAFAGKDSKAAKEIITTFIQENNTSIAKIEQALVADDWEVIKACAHKLIPLMSMIGAQDVVKILYDLENDLQDKATVTQLLAIVRQKNSEADDYLKKQVYSD